MTLRIDLETGMAGSVSDGALRDVRFARIYQVNYGPNGRERKPTLIAGPIVVDEGRGSFRELLESIAASLDLYFDEDDAAVVS